MNVTIENVGPCKKLVRVEVEAKDVDAAFEAVGKDFARQAALPGFRPGKAPREMVLKRFEKEIAEEAKQKLTRENYQEAIKRENLKVYSVQDLEDIQFGKGQPMIFAATVEVLPEFELPEYHKLPAVRENSVIGEASVDEALEALRKQEAKFETVQRPLANGDIAVVTYNGTCEGRPISEIAPSAKGLAANQHFWVKAEAGSFLPGFVDQLLGAAAGEKRTVKVDFPGDFVVKELAGKQGVYEVELVEVKETVLPPLDDEFARKYDAADLNALRAGVRKDLENELEYRKRKAVRNQVVQALLNKVNFDLPESAVAAETRHVVYDIVADSRRRGVQQAEIEKAKDEIYSMANQSAKDRVKASFLFNRIAEKENLKVTQDELSRRIYQLAQQYQMPVDKFVKELEKREGLPEIHQQLLAEKVIEFLADNAEITETVPVPAA